MTKKFNADNVIIKMSLISENIGNNWSLVMIEYYDRETGKLVLQRQQMISVLDRWRNVVSFCDYRNKDYENICHDDWFFEQEFKQLEKLTYEV